MEASGSSTGSPAGCEQTGSLGGWGEQGRGLRAASGKDSLPGVERGMRQAELQHDGALTCKVYAVGVEWRKQIGQKGAR